MDIIYHEIYISVFSECALLVLKTLDNPFIVKFHCKLYGCCYEITH
jgi:hypothetical protein